MPDSSLASSPPAAASVLSVAVLRLSMILAAAHSPPHAAADQGLAAPDPPIWNLRVDAAQRRLTWDLWDNVTDVVCIRGLGRERKATARSHCQYPFLPMCQPANFTVRTTREPRFSASILYPLPDGIPGSAAEHLSCWVHEVDTVTCSWDVGPAAPSDTQYHLHWEDLRTRRVRACQHYSRDPRGVHVACDFRGFSGASGNLQRFWVSGSSAEGPVPCSEVLHPLPEIERLSAGNLSSTCNRSRAELRWAVSSRLQTGFQFQVTTQQGSNAPQTRTTWENRLSLPHAGDFVVRVRAQGLDYYGHWGPWGAPQHFSCKGDDPAPPGGAWVSAALAVLGALLVATAALVLWSRSSLTEKLFPRIPQLRDPFGDHLPSGHLVFQDKQDGPGPAVEIVQEL